MDDGIDEANVEEDLQDDEDQEVDLSVQDDEESQLQPPETVSVVVGATNSIPLPMPETNAEL